MASTRYPSFGPISEGTLRAEDLIPSFDWELSRLAPGEARRIRGRYRRVFRVAAERWTEEDRENAVSCIEELEEALCAACGPYQYYGAHEGDGACFGFWFADEQFREDRHFADSGLYVVNDHDGKWPSARWLKKKGYHVMAEVSDHGNVSIYSIGGRYLYGVV